MKNTKIRTRLSAAMAERLRRLWEAGVSLKVIGVELAMSNQTVVNWAKELGLAPRRRGGQSGPAAARRTTGAGGNDTAKQRKCLGGCGKLFFSDHVGHRVCGACEATLRWLDGADSEFTLRGPAAGCAE